MSGYLVEIDYEGKTNDGFKMHLRMRKAFRDEPKMPIFFEEIINGHVQAVRVSEWERIERNPEILYRVKAIPDDEFVSYVDRIASAFKANGWDVTSADVI